MNRRRALPLRSFVVSMNNALTSSTSSIFLSPRAFLLTVYPLLAILGQFSFPESLSSHLEQQAKTPLHSFSLPFVLRWQHMEAYGVPSQPPTDPASRRRARPVCRRGG